MHITKMSEFVGAEITGVQMASLDASGVSEIKAALAEHGMLHFRDQLLTPEQHIAFAKSWSGIDVNPFFPVNSGHPEIAEVRKSEEQTTNIGGGWHTDHSFDPVPSMGSILVARELPPSGGDTLFASMAAAYDALSPGLQATLKTLRAVHSADHIYAADGYFAQTDMAADMHGQDHKTGAVHPVIIKHPVNGRPLLYVNGAFTLHFEGWTREESQALLTYLYTVAAQEAHQCRIQWKPGDVAIWDNRSTWHWAMNDYHGHRRVMHRITLSGVPLEAALRQGGMINAVKTTGIYCLPSCSARPKPENVVRFNSVDEARAAGFRACKRCKPDHVIRFAIAETTLGPMLVAATDKGICRLSFDEGEAELRARFPKARIETGDAAFGELVKKAIAAVENPARMPDLPLDVAGTAFQQAVWAELRRIPPGETRTYAELAAAIGKPKAVRAAGTANGANRVAVLIPCHRVIGTDGTLRGYAYGVERKAELLKREGVQTPST